jgi:hypothetical protein
METGRAAAELTLPGSGSATMFRATNVPEQTTSATAKASAEIRWVAAEG